MKALLLAMTLGMIVGTANAATISQTISLSPSNFNTEYGEAIVSPAHFDTSLGTLFLITGDLSISFAESYHSGFTPNPKPMQLAFTSHLDVLLDGVASSAPTQSVVGNIDTSNRVSVSDSFKDFMFSAPATNRDSAPDLRIDVYAVDLAAGPSDTPFTQAGGQLVLTYDFTPVPEPGSLALLAFAALGVAAIGRRKVTCGMWSAGARG